MRRAAAGSNASTGSLTSPLNWIASPQQKNEERLAGQVAHPWDKKSLDAFYAEELNAVRGGDNVPRLELALKRAHGGRLFQAFLAGHSYSYCGKTTELARLSQRIKATCRTVRFSASNELKHRTAWIGLHRTG